MFSKIPMYLCVSTNLKHIDTIEIIGIFYVFLITYVPYVFQKSALRLSRVVIYNDQVPGITIVPSSYIVGIGFVKFNKSALWQRV